MLKDAAEVVSKLWASWSLLLGATLVFGLLWFAPITLVLDKDVLQVFNKYRGHIGFAALVLVLVTSVRTVIALALFASHKVFEWHKRQPRLKAIEKEQKAVLLRIQYLEMANREFLKFLIDKKQQQFSLPNNGNDHSWVGDYADVVMASIGVPYTEYKIKPWIWKYKPNPSALEVEAVESKSTSRA
ncbi:MAG: superinfection exclusion B family protein [Sulfuritalea sp.]|nr:superinfection exclusion B family protein [Sulfuritalea sp.]